MRAINIKVEHLKNPLGIDIQRPYISWNCEGGISQSAYEISEKVKGKEIWNSGKVSSSKMHSYLKGELHSRDRVEVEITLYDESESKGDISKAYFEMGLLLASDWTAKWINPEEVNLLEVNHRPASYLKKSFELRQMGNARFYITAHGIYEAWLNGKRVGDAILAPGTSEYEKRLEYQTYDVSELLQLGKNEIQVILGDGWYRGKSGMNNIDGNLFGTDISLLAQLEVDGEVVCQSDESWMASQEGPIRKNGLDFGERVDAGKGDGIFATEGFHSVRLENFSKNLLTCSNNVVIKEHEILQGKVFHTPNGQTVVDFGQNIAGYSGFLCKAKYGQKIRLVHGETLDQDGNFTIDNFQHESMDPKKMIYQETEYICKDGENNYKPKFAIFGFQYILVEGDIPAEELDLKAYALYSDMEETGSFVCGNKDVNKLFENSLWSMKGNFVDIPTDCPTRERQGWTGDAQAFAPTAVYLMDCYPVLRKWLNEVRCEQFPDGKVPGVAPKNEVPGRFKKMSDGSAGWADAIGIVPNVLAKTYDCDDILSENYDAFKNWVNFSKRRAKKNRFKAKFKLDKHKKYIVDTGFHWGEWLEPGVEPKDVLTETIMKGAPEVPTAYFAYSAGLLSDDAKRLGKQKDAVFYQELSEHVKEAYRAYFVKEGKIQSKRQAAYVRPIALGLLTKQEKEDAAKKLNEMVIENNYHLNTGFLSTPYLCKVLTEFDYADTAYRLLLQDSEPSWLNAVKKGATTIWETWDGKQEDGSVHDSLNHYSYGAVTGWLFSDVVGIRLDYGQITIAPHPNKELGFAKATYKSPLGEICVYWEYKEGDCHYEISIPTNTTATLILPGEEPVILQPGTFIK